MGSGKSREKHVCCSFAAHPKSKINGFLPDREKIQSTENDVRIEAKARNEAQSGIKTWAKILAHLPKKKTSKLFEPKNMVDVV